MKKAFPVWLTATAGPPHQQRNPDCCASFAASRTCQACGAKVGNLRPRSHRTRRCLTLHAKNGAHYCQLECLHSIANNFKQHQRICKSAYVSCVNWALLLFLLKFLKICCHSHFNRAAKLSHPVVVFLIVVVDGPPTPIRMATCIPNPAHATYQLITKCSAALTLMCASVLTPMDSRVPMKGQVRLCLWISFRMDATGRRAGLFPAAALRARPVQKEQVPEVRGCLHLQQVTPRPHSASGHATSA